MTQKPGMVGKSSSLRFQDKYCFPAYLCLLSLSASSTDYMLERWGRWGSQVGCVHLIFSPGLAVSREHAEPLPAPASPGQRLPSCRRPLTLRSRSYPFSLAVLLQRWPSHSTGVQPQRQQQKHSAGCRGAFLLSAWGLPWSSMLHSASKHCSHNSRMSHTPTGPLVLGKTH